MPKLCDGNHVPPPSDVIYVRFEPRNSGVGVSVVMNEYALAINPDQGSQIRSLYFVPRVGQKYDLDSTIAQSLWIQVGYVRYCASSHHFRVTLFCKIMFENKLNHVVSLNYCWTLIVNTMNKLEKSGSTAERITNEVVLRWVNEDGELTAITEHIKHLIWVDKIAAVDSRG